MSFCIHVRCRASQEQALLSGEVPGQLPAMPAPAILALGTETAWAAQGFWERGLCYPSCWRLAPRIHHPEFTILQQHMLLCLQSLVAAKLLSLLGKPTGAAASAGKSWQALTQGSILVLHDASLVAPRALPQIVHLRVRGSPWLVPGLGDLKRALQGQCGEAARIWRRELPFSGWYF